MRIPERINQLFSSRWASVIIVILSIAGRVVQKVHFARATGDKLYQIQGTKNLLQGNGLSIYEVFLNDLSSPHYTPILKWPPGYSLLLAPFYAVSGEDFLWGSILLDIIACIFFVVFARKTIRLFAVSTTLTNFYTLVSGFVIFEFCKFPSSDLVSLVFFQIALYLTLRFTSSSNKTYKSVFLIGFLLFMAGMVRFMFIPIAFVIPVYLLANATINREKQLLSKASFLLLVISLAFAALLLFQQSYAGAAAFSDIGQKGFYPCHLAGMDAFIFSSLLNVPVATTLLSKMTRISYLQLQDLIRLANLVVLFLALALFLAWLFRKKLIRPSLTDHFIYMGSFASVMVIAILIYLSISHSPTHFYPPHSTWTFLNESRFYSIPIIFIQQLIIIGFSRYQRGANKWARGFLFACMVLLFVNLLQGLNYTFKILSGRNNLFFQEEQFPLMDYSKKLLNETITQNPGKFILVYSNEPGFNNFASLWANIPGLYDDGELITSQLGTEKETLIGEKLNSMEFSATRESLVFMVISDQHAYKVRSLLANPGVKQVGQLQDFKFFTLNVPANVQR